MLISIADGSFRCLPPSTGGIIWVAIRRGQQTHLSLRYGSAAITAEGHLLEDFPSTVRAIDTVSFPILSLAHQTLCRNPAREIEVSRFWRATLLSWLWLAILGHQAVAVVAFATQYALYRETPGADLSCLPRAGSHDLARSQVLDRAPLVWLGSCRHRRIILERTFGDKARVCGDKARVCGYIATTFGGLESSSACSSA